MTQLPLKGVIDSCSGLFKLILTGELEFLNAELSSIQVTVTWSWLLTVIPEKVVIDKVEVTLFKILTGDSHSAENYYWQGNSHFKEILSDDTHTHTHSAEGCHWFRWQSL